MRYLVIKKIVPIVLLSLSFGCSGCQGIRHRDTSAASGTFVPPLSAIHQTPHSATGHLQSNTTSNSAQSAYLPPPVPETEAQSLGLTPQLPTLPIAATPATSIGDMAAPSQMTSSDIHTASMTSSSQEHCVPNEDDWRKTVELQTRSLLDRLKTVESELSENRTHMELVNENLANSEQRIHQLSEELTHWKGETRRVESEMRAQQESDLKSLDELTMAVNGLLSRQRTAQRENKP
jgi:hypothetical protein